MGRSRLFWQITAPLAALLVVGFLAVSWQASRTIREFHAERIAVELSSAGALIDEAFADLLEQPDRAVIDPAAKRLGQGSSLRVTVIAPDGTVLGESHGHIETMDNHASRPEVVEALRSGIGTADRWSDSVDAQMKYSARAVRRDGRLLGIVRTATPLTVIAEADRRLLARALLAASVVAMLTLTCGFWVARRLSRPLEQLEGLAEAYAKGELDRPLPTSGSLEVERVAAAMQKMAIELDQRIGALVAERNEQEAVLSSMVEGVLVIDPSERLMAVNAAAARLLGVDERQATGRTVREVTDNASLQAFVREALRSPSPVERDVPLDGDEPRFLQVHGAPVRDATGARIGAVVVLNDVTRLRRLETVRRDFVANVSHELKTPVTSIKGFLETLLEGAVDDPANARRFLEIAARQADRLGAIIEDLLLLSRVEQDSDQYAIEKIPTALDPVVRGAVDVCRLKADRKGVRIDVRCEGDLQAKINPALLEQAVVNLVDNAIKYSDAGSAVEITTHRDGNAAVLTVRDHGAGIEAEHLPRLFERFYRVDKARSRALGGTGLGLAIVKHIVQAQGGSVDVESRPGTGTTFTLRFPLA